ncbi:kinase-like domain-containing protein [Rhizoctonia solani]|nr:kinase-like domain-containing protein [Rhizoctonia solani]
MIRSGRIPSDRPRGARGSLINDTLWSVLSSCWRAQDWRPTAEGFLEELNRMLHSGEVPRSPILMDLFTSSISEPILPWPLDINDLHGKYHNDTLAVRSRSLRATVWRAHTEAGKSVIIKVPRLNASFDNQTRHDHLENIFWRVVLSRYEVHHPNIIEFLGITSEFSPHERLVFETCYQWSLSEYRMKRVVVIDEYTRSTDPYPTSHSLMVDILEGLRYMHGYPIPITQGDLTPENILVDDQGRAKISLFSFGRILTTLPRNVSVTGTVESTLSFQYISGQLTSPSRPSPYCSPECRSPLAFPTLAGDVWSFGATVLSV